MKKTILGVVFLAVGIYLYMHPRVLMAPGGVATMFAKEYCSCRFVVGQSEDFCLRRVKQLYNVLPVKLNVDFAKKNVKSSFLVYSASSSFVSARFGCKID